MTEQFLEDLEASKSAVGRVLSIFDILAGDQYTFIDVENDESAYYKGDIKAIDATGREIFIEVKNDGTIGTTGNVLCEEKVYYKEEGYYGKGNMHSDYDIYVVVSEDTGKIYVIDFSVLKANYTKGFEKEIEHEYQITYCYLCPLSAIEEWGGLIATLDF